MKTQLQTRRRGVALVLVITFLALLTGLIVAFLSTVSTESQVSTRAAATSRGRELIDTVNAVVMGQIRDATSQGSEVAWATQPGMIRTYGTADGKASASPLRYYKLYSAQKLVWSAADGTFAPGADVPAGWSDNAALYTDLNRPVTTLNGAQRYPIFQPPSLTPPAPPAAQPPVGLKMGTPPLASANTGGSTLVNQAPMPVRWLYLLRDGRLTSPSQSTAANADGTGAKVMWQAGAPDAPTAANPIVGRVAFWTDDETNKININTASGDRWTAASAMDAGTYWDLPRVNSQFDRQALANFQPAQREYQRYPGHPATTYLSAAFPSLTRTDLALISTRIQGGGSLGGTTLATAPVSIDGDRLYAYEDELIFDNLRGASVVTPDQLEQSRFLITANSRAPEVNLMNQPRIAAWPVSVNPTSAYRSPYDRLIAFCSRIGNKNYIFDRLYSDSPTADYTGRNVELYTYLQRLTSGPVPGFGGNFSTKYGADRDQILTEIFDYIRSTNLFDDTIEPQPMVYPTTGKQYTDGRSSQTGALPGHGQVTPIRIGSTQGFGRFMTFSEVAMHFIATADFTVPESNVVPADNVGQPTAKPTNRTLGSGMSAVKLKTGERRIEAMLLLEAFSPSQGWGPLRPDMQVRIKGLNSLSVNGTNLGFPSEGTVRIESNGGYHSRMWGGSSGTRFILNNRRLPARGVVAMDDGWNTNNSYPFVSIPITVVVGPAATMQFNGGDITIEIFSDSQPGNGLYDNLSVQVPVQTLKVNLPGGTFPVPRLAMSGTPYPPSTTDTQSVATTREYWWTFSRDGALVNYPTYTPTANVPAYAKGAGRMHRIAADPGNRTTQFSGQPIHYVNASTPSDVVRSVVVAHGDYRVLAAQAEPSKDMWVKHRYYDDVSKYNGHSLQESVGSNYMSGSDDQAGAYVTGAPYSSNKRPDIPVDAIPLAMATGDWDTGSAAVHDGAYINKPDEGNNYREAGGVPYFDANQAHETTGPTFFSPNRQIPSPVMFGSLPTQVKAGKPWTTLLFRPDVTGTHIGKTSPPDHLLLDLFWMPVVEPYAISEPFSTAGKINMNHQIVPFTYIDRTTALRALLRSERVLAVPNASANVYKGTTVATNYRHEINADETLKQFKERFDAGDIFRSASEICQMFLVPENETLSNMSTYWQTNNITADNSREHPYATLYPRLTTKSNTYRVHYRVQSLQQATRRRGDDPEAWATWEEDTDRIVAENRGSSIIERYVDPADPALPDYATTANASLDPHYRFRIIGSTKFGPK